MGAAEEVLHDWGRAAISYSQARAFAEIVPTTQADRELVARTLADFPMECQCRGMFFDGLVGAIESTRGAAARQRVVELAAVPRSLVPFALRPHRDFYKLFFLGAATLHPRMPLDRAMQMVAETFYPVFQRSMVGRTMSVFMGDEPSRMIGRLAEAYRLSVTWNEHSVKTLGPKAAEWTAKVEPCPFYPSVFSGIVLGTMRTHGVDEPKIETLSREREGAAMRFVFRIGWS